MTGIRPTCLRGTRRGEESIRRLYTWRRDDRPLQASAADRHAHRRRRRRTDGSTAMVDRRCQAQPMFEAFPHWEIRGKWQS